MNYIVAFLIHWMIREPEDIEVPHQRADYRRHPEGCNGNIDGKCTALINGLQIVCSTFQVSGFESPAIDSGEQRTCLAVDSV